MFAVRNQYLKNPRPLDARSRGCCSGPCNDLGKEFLPSRHAHNRYPLADAVATECLGTLRSQA